MISTCCGLHLILELFQCDKKTLTDPKCIEMALLEASESLNANVIQKHFHHFGENSGVTGVLLLKESHMSIHSWPEWGYAAIDIFMCGQPDMQPAIQLLTTRFNSQHSTSYFKTRGLSHHD